MAAPRPKKKAPVKKAKPKAKDDNFSKFKKSYKEGKVKMLANPPPMPGPAKAAAVVNLVSKAAKDLRSTNPKSLRNKALREANRAANQNKPKYKEKIGPNRPQGPEAPKYSEKIGPTRPAPSAASSASTATRGIRVKRSTALAIGASSIPIGIAIGTGIVYGIKGVKYLTQQSDKDKKSPVSKTTGAGRPEFPSSNKGKKKIPMKPAPGANYSGQSSTYSGYGNGNFNPPKTSAANTAATSTAAAGGGGSSKAASVAPASSSKTKVGRLTRYQRNETAMEQKRSSSRPKKSIFSLFRKG